jgi:hypothetical protein
MAHMEASSSRAEPGPEADAAKTSAQWEEDPAWNSVFDLYRAAQGEAQARSLIERLIREAGDDPVRSQLMPLVAKDAYWRTEAEWSGPGSADSRGLSPLAVLLVDLDLAHRLELGG